MINVLFGILIPFAGTTLGSALVFFMKNNLSPKIEKFFLGFASGVMIAASVWSLLIPSIENAGGNLPQWIPATLGLCIGFFVLFVIDEVVTRFKLKRSLLSDNLKDKSIMFFAITLHNIPEGLAVGVALAGSYFGSTSLSLMSALLLSFGIAVQNFPEGAIVSLPLMAATKKKFMSFFWGSMSGIVEPIAAIIAFFVTGFVSSILSYVLAFAAGAMIYVVIKDLIPESQQRGYEKIATLGFLIGFIIMMLLDIIMG